MSQFVTRIPGKAGPTSSALGVVELNDATFALETLKPSNFGSLAFVPQRTSAVQRFYAIVAFDLVLHRGVTHNRKNNRLFDFLAVYRSNVVYRVGACKRRVDLAVSDDDRIAFLIRHDVGNLYVYRLAVLVAHGCGRNRNFAAGIAAFVIIFELDSVTRNVDRYRADISLTRVDGKHHFVPVKVGCAKTPVNYRNRFASGCRDFGCRTIGFAVAALDVEHGRKIVVVAVYHRHCRVGKVHRRDFLRRLGRRRASDRQRKRERRCQKCANKFYFFHLLNFPPFGSASLCLGFKKSLTVRFFISL